MKKNLWNMALTFDKGLIDQMMLYIHSRSYQSYWGAGKELYNIGAILTKLWHILNCMMFYIHSLTSLFFSHFEMSPYVDVQFPIQTYKAAMVLQCHVKAVFFKILTKGIWISTYLFLHARKFCESWENIVITIKLLLAINQF